MSIEDILKSKAQSPNTSKKKSEPKDLTLFLAFFAWLHTNAIRLSYEGAHVVAASQGLIKLHEIGKPSAHRVCNWLPLEHQYLVCRTKGGYSKAALDKWEHAAPEGFEDLPILPKDDVEEIFNAFSDQQ